LFETCVAIKFVHDDDDEQWNEDNDGDNNNKKEDNDGLRKLYTWSNVDRSSLVHNTCCTVDLPP